MIVLGKIPFGFGWSVQNVIFPYYCYVLFGKGVGDLYNKKWKQFWCNLISIWRSIKSDFYMLERGIFCIMFHNDDQSIKGFWVCLHALYV